MVPPLPGSPWWTLAVLEMIFICGWGLGINRSIAEEWVSPDLVLGSPFALRHVLSRKFLIIQRSEVCDGDNVTSMARRVHILSLDLLLHFTLATSRQRPCGSLSIHATSLLYLFDHRKCTYIYYAVTGAFLRCLDKGGYFHSEAVVVNVLPFSFLKYIWLMFAFQFAVVIWRCPVTSVALLLWGGVPEYALPLDFHSALSKQPPSLNCHFTKTLWGYSLYLVLLSMQSKTGGRAMAVKVEHVRPEDLTLTGQWKFLPSEFPIFSARLPSFPP